MTKHIGKLGGYAIAILLLSWIALTAGPALIDSASDGKVLAGAVLYILWFTAIGVIGVDIVKTVKRVRRER